MNLPFSQIWPKKMGDIGREPTYFPNKIIIGLLSQSIPTNIQDWVYENRIDEAIGVIPFIVEPKNHTIRKGNRWKPGMMIDFWINYRTKNQFRFAPRIPAIDVHEFVIEKKQHLTKNTLRESNQIWIGGSKFSDPVDIVCEGNGVRLSYSGEVQNFIHSDGFDSVDHFFRWFNQDFRGQLIHWTSLTY